MNVTTARRIDFVLGTALCMVFRTAHMLRIGRGRHPEAPPEDSPRILVIKCFGFGSILQMCPMLASLRKARPEAHITLMTFAQNASLARLVPMVDEVETVEFRRGLLRFGLDTLRLVGRLRRQHFDVILDCEFFSYYVAVFAYLVRRPSTVTVGFFNNRRARDWLFTHLISIDASQHISRVFCKMLLPLGIRPQWRPLQECTLRFSEDARKRVASLMTELGVDSQDKQVVVNVNASDLCPSRRWSLDSFERLIERLLDDHSGEQQVRRQVLLIGGPEDVAYVSGLAKRFSSPNVHNLAGRISIEELTALMHTADLFVGNDSGPLHLAVMAGLPTVSLFGPETPSLYGPVGERHKVFYAQAFCSPCLNLFYSKDMRCRENICLKAISSDEVYEAVAAALAAGQDRPRTAAHE